MDAVARAPGTREQLLAAARERFAAHGFAGTSLSDIAHDVGIRRPSLLHHFPSKEALYRAVLLDEVTDWITLVDQAKRGPREGWPRAEGTLLATFTFFEEHPALVRIFRWEALEGGPILREELAQVLRPLFERAVAFLEREMDAGRLQRHDARNLVLTGYGAILSYFSDAPLITSLVDDDPLSTAALRRRRRHVIDFFRQALVPPTRRDPQETSDT